MTASIHSTADRAGTPYSTDKGAASAASTPVAKESHPTSPCWNEHRMISQLRDTQLYVRLKSRLTEIPTRSAQSRQTLYLDLWNEQHWLGLTLSYPDGVELLFPVSVDTALSLATIGRYRVLGASVNTSDSEGQRLPCHQRGSALSITAR